MATTIFHLCAELGRAGHRVTVITRRGSGEAPALDGIRIVEVPWLKVPMAFTRSYGRQALKALKEVHAEDPVDVVHVHAPLTSWSRRQFRLCHSKVAPSITTLHGSWIGERDGLLMARRMKEPAAIANPNDLAILLTAGHYARFEQAAVDESVCVAISAFSRNEFIERYRTPSPWACEVVHWGIDTTMFRPANTGEADAIADLRRRLGAGEGQPLLLAVGRLAARKGYATLLKGFAHLHASAPEVKLAIVGRGHLRSRLLKQAQRLGVDSAVRIESSLPFDELAMAYRAADLVVFPSLYEGLGMIPIEAMASGTPVVTVNHGPMPETVDAAVGATYTLGDADGFSSTVLKELGDRDALAKKGHAGRARVLERFSMQQEVEAYLAAYGRAMDGVRS
jgi:glycosyltransferase involved in cell wall biosynthesis